MEVAACEDLAGDAQGWGEGCPGRRAVRSRGVEGIAAIFGDLRPADTGGSAMVEEGSG